MAQPQARLTTHRRSTNFWSHPFLALTLILLCLLSGCETLSSRLERNLEALHSLPQPHQDLIRQGHVNVGFSAFEVYLAWGAPDHKAITENTQGSLETWVYTIVRSETYYRHRRLYDPTLERWEYTETPYQVHTEYVTKEAAIIDGRLNAFTLYPSAQPY